MSTLLPLLVLPFGSVFATVPAGQAESIGLSSTEASRPASERIAFAAATDLHVTSGMLTRLP